MLQTETTPLEERQARRHQGGVGPPTLGLLQDPRRTFQVSRLGPLCRSKDRQGGQPVLELGLGAQIGVARDHRAQLQRLLMGELQIAAQKGLLSCNPSCTRPVAQGQVDLAEGGQDRQRVLHPARGRQSTVGHKQPRRVASRQSVGPQPPKLGLGFKRTGPQVERDRPGRDPVVNRLRVRVQEFPGGPRKWR
ncbi:MAG: hypothetical protein IPG45_04470 [Deltaproteobacteria bacterium]|nr:hypothetical protein [Deltaproteobacteria bacterium]